MRLTTFITETRWGAKSLVSLYVSIISGVVVSLQYDWTTPLFSASSIDVLIPFGVFWRSLHFYSSQLFFLFCLVHLLAVILENTEKLSHKKWFLLVGSVPVSLLLLFTGYVLRADATGEAAGFIAENISLSIPYFGTMVNDLLFAIEAEGMKRVYANHLIGLGVVWVICCWDHLRRYRVSLGKHGLLLAAMLIFSIYVAAPMEPEQWGTFHIAGPWFFLGLQEILRYVDSFWAGVVFPTTLIIALALVVFEGKIRPAALRYVVLWLSLYALLSVISSLR